MTNTTAKVAIVMTVTINRISQDIFKAQSDIPYWSDGSPINERLAFNGSLLSNSQAQAIDRKNGLHYIIVTPFGLKNPETIARALALEVGQSFSFAKTLMI